ELTALPTSPAHKFQCDLVIARINVEGMVAKRDKAESSRCQVAIEKSPERKATQTRRCCDQPRGARDSTRDQPATSLAPELTIQHSTTVMHEASVAAMIVHSTIVSRFGSSTRPY